MTLTINRELIMKTRNILFIGALATVIACSKNEDTKTSAVSNVIEFEVSTDDITTKGEVATTEKVYNDNYKKTFSLSAVTTSQHTESGDIIIPGVEIDGTNDFNALLEQLTGQHREHVDAAKYYFHDSEVFHNGHWYLDKDPKTDKYPTWPAGDRLSFWVVGHMNSLDDNSMSVHFYALSYSDMTMYGGDGYGLAFGINIAAPDKNKCALNQKDLLLAFDPSKSMADGKVKLHFKHVLSGIRFVLGDIPQEWTVSDIKIGNVLSTKYCVYWSAYEWFNWRDWWESEDSQEVIKAKEAPFIQEYCQNYLVDGSYEYNEENMTFWMVPQENRTAKMTVKFVNKNDSTLTREFALNVPITWESGHLYRYRINYDGKDMTDIVLGDVNVEDYTPGTTPEIVFD